jgi:undecaprenyl pyrophosphate phosphatase UppP
MFMTLIREADKQNGVIWALMLSVPAMVVLALLDIIAIFTVGVGSVTLLILAGYFVSALFAFIGAFIGVSFIRMLISRSDYSVFAYYDFGLALFSFIVYLIV